MISVMFYWINNWNIHNWFLFSVQIINQFPGPLLMSNLCHWRTNSSKFILIIFTQVNYSAKIVNSLALFVKRYPKWFECGQIFSHWTLISSDQLSLAFISRIRRMQQVESFNQWISNYVTLVEDFHEQEL